jgi:hypothetical protein
MLNTFFSQSRFFSRIGLLLALAVIGMVIAGFSVIKQTQIIGQRQAAGLASSPVMNSSGVLLIGVPGPGIPKHRTPMMVIPNPSRQLRATRVSYEGIISGRVISDDGTPLAGAVVTAYPAVSPFMRYNKDNPNTATTGADGRYVIRLQTYRPIMMNGPIMWDAVGYTVFVADNILSAIQPLPINVNPDALPDKTAANVNFHLQMGPLVTVQVMDERSGAPIAGVPVQCINNFSMIIEQGATGMNGVWTEHIPLTQFWLKATLPQSLSAAAGFGFGNALQKQITTSPGQPVIWLIKTNHNP